MKRIIYFLVAISLFSCENEIVEQEPLDSESAVQSVSKDLLAENIVQALVYNLGNDSFKSFLKEEALKQRDGDNDILFAEVIDKDINTTTTKGYIGETSFRELLKRGFEKTVATRSSNRLSFEQTLKSIERDYPLLQISIPDTENGTLESIDFEKNPPLVTYVPEDFEESNPIDITAYDKDGNKYTLNTAVEPTVPVVVVGENERLIAVPLKQFINTRMASPYYVNNQVAYFMRANENEFVGGGGGGGSSTPQSKNRNSNNLWDYLTKAKFRNQKAMRKYEAWTNGRPEVKVDIIFQNNVLPSKTIRYDNKGWWKGATRTLNSQIVNWDEEVLGKYITYYWSEEDPGASSDKTINIMITAPNGVTSTVSTTIKAGQHDDEIGTTYVAFTDLIPAGGKEYDPTGSNNFSFWMDLK